MSLASNVSLGALRLQAQDRADLENSQAISTPAWNQYISQSHKRLFNKLVAVYGDDYYVAPLFQFNLGSSQYYPLPNGRIPTVGSSVGAPALFKLLGVDLQYSGAPNGWVTLKRFEEIQRNQYAWPNTAINLLGITNLKYRLSGQNIEFVPVPMSGQLVQLKYIQKPQSLQWLPTCVSTIETAVVTTEDASDLSVGMSAYGPGVQANTLITAIDTTLTPNQITLSKTVLRSAATSTIAFWTDATTIDGVSGWEEFIIIDAAIKARIKQEQDISDLKEERLNMVTEIEGLAEGRDAGQAHHVSDVLSINGWGGDGDCGGGGYGGGGWGL